MNATHTRPLVSVVMIFLDPAAVFFDEAIASVLAQSQPGVELLLCDDGSAAPASEQARSWAARHPGWVRWLEHPGHAHRGMSSSRNLGIEAARADLVAFLDADDGWLPGHLEHEVELLARHPEVGRRLRPGHGLVQLAGPRRRPPARPAPRPAPR